MANGENRFFRNRNFDIGRCSRVHNKPTFSQVNLKKRSSVYNQ